MPRERVSKKDQARRELARDLRKPLGDILPRQEAAVFLGKKGKTSLSNLGAEGPGFYRAPIGKDGYVLYRRDWLEAWAKREKGAKYGEQPWPETRYSGPHADVELMLDDLGVTDDDYRNMVMGRG